MFLCLVPNLILKRIIFFDFGVLQGFRGEIDL